jgi:hypothetical protein
MTDRKPCAEQCTRVYTRTGTRAHLLSPATSPNSPAAALCGTLPEWFEMWRGTGSQDETERAASLPLCKYCQKRATDADRHAESGRDFVPPAGIPQDPAAERAPVARRGARASAPGEPVTSPPPGVTGGKTSPAAAPQLPAAGDPESPRCGRTAQGMPGPETGASSRAPVRARAPLAPVAAVPDGQPASGPAAVTGPARAPAGASGTVSPPAGSSGAEWRAKVKTATSALHAGQRRRATRYVPKAKRGTGAGYRPGMTRRPPPETPGGEAS